ncbi:MAG: YncE family protein, partial [Bryobacteraceae bacterium]
MRWNKTLLPVAVIAVSARFYFGPEYVSAQSPVRFAGPTNSQPLALNADDSLLIVANPDNNSVTLFDAKNGYARLAEVAVGKEPNGVAMAPDGLHAYAANTVDGTVSVLTINRTASTIATVTNTITVGTEPYGLALTPTGRKLYVTNSRSNTVSVIDTTASYSVKTIANVGVEPRGIAITNTPSADDTQETVFVTQFLSLPVAGKFDGADDAKAGHVTAISAATDAVIGDIVINPIADTGFKALGDALAKVAPPATPVAADFKFVTGAYPNQLNNIGIRGKFAFVPNTGASPNGPFRFDVNTQSLLSVIDTTTRKDAGKTINMHSAVAAQTGTPKRFITV